MNTTTGDRRFYVSLCNACEIKPEALVLMLRILDLCATGKASDFLEVVYLYPLMLAFPSSCGSRIVKG